MRLLWARVGIPYSPATGLPIESQTVSQMVDRVLALPEKTRLYLLAPVVRGRKGEYRKEIAEFQKKGFQRLKIDGEFYAIDEAPALDKKFKHDIDVVVDRIVVRARHRRAAGGIVRDRARARGRHRGDRVRGRAAGKRLSPRGGESRRAPYRLQPKFACPVSGFTIPEIEPRLFSFNNPFGACPTCGGIGHEMRVDAALIVPDETATLKRGAIAPWARSTSPYYGQTLESIARHYTVSTTTKWAELPETVRQVILYGSRRADPLRLRRRPARLRGEKAVRGRHHQPGAPLQGDRERLVARGDRPLHERDALRRLRRQAPEARGAGGEDRRLRHRRGYGPLGARGARLVRALPQKLTGSRTRSRSAS